MTRLLALLLLIVAGGAEAQPLGWRHFTPTVASDLREIRERTAANLAEGRLKHSEAGRFAAEHDIPLLLSMLDAAQAEIARLEKVGQR